MNGQYSRKTAGRASSDSNTQRQRRPWQESFKSIQAVYHQDRLPLEGMRMIDIIALILGIILCIIWNRKITKDIQEFERR